MTTNKKKTEKRAHVNVSANAGAKQHGKRGDFNAEELRVLREHMVQERERAKARVSLAIQQLERVVTLLGMIGSHEFAFVEEPQDLARFALDAIAGSGEGAIDSHTGATLDQLRETLAILGGDTAQVDDAAE